MLVVSSRPVRKKELQAGILPKIRKGVILPCAYPVPKLSSSMQAERLELIFLYWKSLPLACPNCTFCLHFDFFRFLLLSVFAWVFEIGLEAYHAYAGWQAGERLLESLQEFEYQWDTEVVLRLRVLLKQMPKADPERWKWSTVTGAAGLPTSPSAHMLP